METKRKRLSIVVYCNGNFDETKETFYSIIDQNMSHLFFDVYVLNDNANKKFTKQISDFIKKEELLNFQIYSFEYYTGMPLTFDFLIKNNVIKSKYVTLIKSGDVFADKFFNYFMDELYPLDNDLYIFDLKDELIIPKEKISEETGKNYTMSKSKIINASIPSGAITQDEAFVTKPIFLGKIWRTDCVRYLKLDDEKILYQDIFMYIQLLMYTTKIRYENKYAGTVRRKSWLPKTLDKKRIELLTNTLNKMVSRNPYVNGHVLQLLALALERSSKDDQKLFLISNYKYLNNYEIVPIYGLSKRKVLKLVNPFLESGKIVEKSKKKKKK